MYAGIDREVGFVLEGYGRRVHQRNSLAGALVVCSAPPNRLLRWFQHVMFISLGFKASYRPKSTAPGALVPVANVLLIGNLPTREHAIRSCKSPRTKRCVSQVSVLFPPWIGGQSVDMTGRKVKFTSVHCRFDWSTCADSNTYCCCCIYIEGFKVLTHLCVQYCIRVHMLL